MINETFFQELLIRQKESGLSVRDFCSNEGIAPSTYYYWLKKHNKNLARPKEFIPLVVRDQFPARKGNRLSTLSNVSTVENEDIPKLEFIFPNGTRLLIRNHADLALLQTMAHLYD